MILKPFILAFPFLAVTAVMPGYSQSCRDIRDAKEFWEQVRILPPVTVTDYDGVRVQYSFATETAVYVASMELYADADVPVAFAEGAWKVKGKTWWLCYCALDRKVFFIQDYAAGQDYLKTRDSRRKRKGED